MGQRKRERRERERQRERDGGGSFPIHSNITDYRDIIIKSKVIVFKVFKDVSVLLMF